MSLVILYLIDTNTLHQPVDAGRACRTVSRDQVLRHERGQGNIHFSCSADHVQDWQPYPVDPYSCYMYDQTYIHTSAGRPGGSVGNLETFSDIGTGVRIPVQSYELGFFLTKKKKIPNKWIMIISLVHKIRLHDRRGKGMTESFS